MKAILLAGGSTKDNKNFDGYKSMIKLKGISMIKYVMDAISSTAEIDEIVIVGNVPALKGIIDGDFYTLVEEDSSLMDNLIKALELVKDQEYILVATCDIPLVNEKIIRSFINEGLKANVELFYPVIDKESCNIGYPDIKRTFATLKEGEFTGGNLILLKPEALSKIENVGRYMITHRKNPFKMCAFFGLRLIIKFLTKTLSIKDLEGYIEGRFNIKARAYHCKAPEICHDLDNPDEIEIFEKYL